MAAAAVVMEVGLVASSDLVVGLTYPDSETGLAMVSQVVDMEPGTEVQMEDPQEMVLQGLLLFAKRKALVTRRR